MVHQQMVKNQVVNDAHSTSLNALIDDPLVMGVVPKMGQEQLFGIRSRIKWYKEPGQIRWQSRRFLISGWRQNLHISDLAQRSKKLDRVIAYTRTDRWQRRTPEDLNGHISPNFHHDTRCVKISFRGSQRLRLRLPILGENALKNPG